MEKIKFTDLIVWQKSHKLFLDVVGDVETFPKKRAADVIANQLLRSSSSTSANIAEGNGRHKGKEYEHYLIVARGSLSSFNFIPQPSFRFIPHFFHVKF